MLFFSIIKNLHINEWSWMCVDVWYILLQCHGHNLGDEDDKVTIRCLPRIINLHNVLMLHLFQYGDLTQDFCLLLWLDLDESNLVPCDLDALVAIVGLVHGFERSRTNQFSLQKNYFDNLFFFVNKIVVGVKKAFLVWKIEAVDVILVGSDLVDPPQRLLPW